MLTVEDVLDEMEQMQAMLCEGIDPPVLASRIGKRVFRYQESGAPQAIVQKLARVVSGLYASVILMQYGLVQEAATLARVLDDLLEDVMFLTKALLADDEKDMLKRYLDNFYDEVIDDPDDTVGSLLRKRRPVSRKDVREATERLDTKLFAHIEEYQPTTDLHRAMSTLYNSFVHAGSPQIMEMYGGTPPRFQVRGLLGTPHMAPHETMLWGRLYSFAMCFSIAGAALARPDVVARAQQLRGEIAPMAGQDHDAG